MSTTLLPSSNEKLKYANYGKFVMAGGGAYSAGEERMVLLERPVGVELRCAPWALIPRPDKMPEMMFVQFKPVKEASYHADKGSGLYKQNLVLEEDRKTYKIENPLGFYKTVEKSAEIRTIEGACERFGHKIDNKLLDELKYIHSGKFRSREALTCAVAYTPRNNEAPIYMTDNVRIIYF